jgi:hypothetical protein
LRGTDARRQQMTLAQLISGGLKGWHGIKPHEPDWSEHSHSIAVAAGPLKLTPEQKARRQQAREVNPDAPVNLVKTLSRAEPYTFSQQIRSSELYAGRLREVRFSSFCADLPTV